MPRTKKIKNDNVIFVKDFSTPGRCDSYFDKHYRPNAKLVAAGVYRLNNGNYVRKYMCGVEELKSVDHLWFYNWYDEKEKKKFEPKQHRVYEDDI